MVLCGDLNGQKSRLFIDRSCIGRRLLQHLQDGGVIIAILNGKDKRGPTISRFFFGGLGVSLEEVLDDI